MTENAALHSVLVSLAECREQIATLQLQVAALVNDQPGYNPNPSIKWWALTSEEREASKLKIRGWYTKIYVPMYGSLAVLPNCWEQHQLLWTMGDWLTELWSYLYISKRRSPSMLSAQAELTIRVLPAVADIIRRECKNCSHDQIPASNGHAVGAR